MTHDIKSASKLVRVDVLLKASMVRQMIEGVRKKLQKGEVAIEGHDNETVRAALECGSLQESLLQELIGKEQLDEIRSSCQEQDEVE